MEVEDDVNDSSQRLLIKRKPQFLIEAIEKLNETQIEAVKSLGFGHILKYAVDHIPSIFAHSLLKGLNPETCSIKLRSGKEIFFTKEDVQLTFGFPQGERVYHIIERESHAAFMRELAEYGNMKPGNVSHKRVESLMLADKEGGIWFKRLFMVLLEAALIETSSCGTIKSKIGHMIEDMDSVANINWCGYTISVLKFAMKNWLKPKKRRAAFSGPLAFLALSYVDRVVLNKRQVPRCFPTMIGWTGQLLQDREDEEIKAFGLGRLERRYNGHLVQQQDGEEDPDEDDSDAGSSYPPLDLKFVDDVMKYIKQMNLQQHAVSISVE